MKWEGEPPLSQWVHSNHSALVSRREKLEVKMAPAEDDPCCAVMMGDASKELGNPGNFSGYRRAGRPSTQKQQRLPEIL